ncbi:hypothetical protein ACWEQL_12425 [Kitasatospora sp. NPDC004240]
MQEPPSDQDPDAHQDPDAGADNGAAGRVEGVSGDMASESALSRFVLRAAMKDPAHLPELLAHFAVHHLGSRAAASVARARERRPGAEQGDLAEAVITRGRRVSQSEGAFVGGPLMIFAPFAFCTALLTQSRMMLELGALTGRDPTDPDRAAELLVIQGVYPDEERARAALAAAAAARPDSPPGRVAALWSVVRRMAYLLGVVTPDKRPVSVWVRVWRWVLVVVVLLIGFVVPLVWLPYLGYSYHRASQELGERAWAYYRGEATVWPEETAARARPALVGAIFKGVLWLLVPAVVLTFLVLADLRLAGSRYPVITVALVTLSVVLASGWWLRRRRRRRAED